MKITVIGAGNMGGALAKGWAKAITSGKAEGLEVTVADRAVAALEKIGGEFPVLHTTSSNTDAVKGADIVMLAVKPWLVEIVANEEFCHIVKEKNCSIFNLKLKFKF